VPRACCTSAYWPMKTLLAVSMASIIARVMSGVCVCAEGRARVALTRMLILEMKLGLGVVHRKKTPRSKFR
jgi:hypothetical protein